MPTPEEQRILDLVNRDRRDQELTGWIAFFMGLFLASLLFVGVLIPHVIEPEILNGQTTSGLCQTN